MERPIKQTVKLKSFLENLHNIISIFLGIPAAEKFAFCLNTLLSDIAVRCPQNCDAIISTQVETLNTLTNLIKSNRENGSVPPITLCKATVPLFLGLARSMGRYSQSDPALLCLLFPKPKKILDHPQIPNSHKLNEKKQFRSIIPRSMSSSLSLDLSAKDPHSNASFYHHKNLLRKHSFPFDPTTYFFAKYGSSFYQFPNMKFGEQSPVYQKIQFPIQHLQTIFAMSKRILTKDILEYLDEQAGDIFALHQIKCYGYKTFSETINLVMVTLMRELLQNETDLPAPFTKDVQEFVKRIYMNGQTELQNKQFDSESKKDPSAKTLQVVNKYKINVLANAACVDLLVWAVGDESGKLLIILMTKIF